MEDVDLKKSHTASAGLAARKLAPAAGGGFGADKTIHGITAQIDTDEQLARQLQAEEDKLKTKYSNPTPVSSLFGLGPTAMEIKSQFTSSSGQRGSTLECWVNDSLAKFGQRVGENAGEFFGKTARSREKRMKWQTVVMRSLRNRCNIKKVPSYFLMQAMC